MSDSSRPYQKFETYDNFKGINNKISEYVDGPMEVRDLRNLAFDVPGALSSMPGSSFYMPLSTGLTAGMTTPVTGLHEYIRVQPFAGQGYNTVNNYLIESSILNLYSWSGGLHPTDITPPANTWNFPASLMLYDPYTANMDMLTFADYAFMADGGYRRFVKYNGSTLATYFSLPPHPNGPTYSIGAVTLSGYTGLYTYAFGYLNERGYAGPAGGTFTVPLTDQTPVVISGFTTPDYYGVTSIIVYRTTPNGNLLQEVGSLPAGGATFVDFNYPFGPPTDPYGPVAPNTLWFTLFPKYMEIFSNSVAYSGFLNLQSTLYLSDVGEPEGIPPENFIEVRTNDGDFITGIKQYSGDLYIFKRYSFSRLVGDSPENYALNTLATDFGCVSNKAVVTFNNIMWFLDSKGIAEFNGASPRIISNDVEDIFLTMKLDSNGTNSAAACHQKARNEVWFSIPTSGNRDSNGTLINDTTVVYDYFSDAWTIRDNITPTCYAQSSFVYSNPETRKMFFGSNSGTIQYFDRSLINDTAGPFTALVKFNYVAPLGKTVDKEFRRLYVDLENQGGVTQTVSVKLYPNFQNSASVSVSYPVSPTNSYRKPLNFGVDARSLAVELSYSSSSLPIRIYGQGLDVQELRRF